MNGQHKSAVKGCRLGTEGALVHVATAATRSYLLYGHYYHSWNVYLVTPASPPTSRRRKSPVAAATLHYAFASTVKALYVMLAHASPEFSELTPHGHSTQAI
jgi:hypothetical protein